MMVVVRWALEGMKGRMMTGAFRSVVSWRTVMGVIRPFWVEVPGAFSVVHLGEERWNARSIGTLVLVDPILVKPIVAGPIAGIVDRQAEIVTAEEPLEPFRLPRPGFVLGGAKASRHARPSPALPQAVDQSPHGPSLT